MVVFQDYYSSYYKPHDGVVGLAQQLICPSDVEVKTEVEDLISSPASDALQLSSRTLRSIPGPSCSTSQICSGGTPPFPVSTLQSGSNRDI
jgi:hypothetical protein